jgi:outer membrane protein assembly factor BamB
MGGSPMLFKVENMGEPPMTQNERPMTYMKNRWQVVKAAGILFASVLAFGSPKSRADDFTMWGRTPDRNMIVTEKGVPTEWDVEKGANIKWVAQLGSKSYGNPIINNGVVFVGTNNEAHKDEKFQRDAGVLMAFNEKDGKFLWQRISAKLPTGRVNDWPGEGLCSTVLCEGGKLYYCTNRCEVVCLDVSPGTPGYKEVWTTDMIKQFGVFPHNMTSCAILPYENLLFIITGNGVDDTHKHVVSPNAPAIVCINKADGKLVWSDNSPLDHVLHGQWASPALAMVNGKALVIAPEGDGWIRAYEAKTGKIVWRFDSNPKDSTYPQTRNEIIATPVIYKNRMYIANGQDPEHGEGPGQFWCIDITKEGDISFEVDADPNAALPKIGEELVVATDQAKRPKGKPNPNSGVVWHFSAIGGDAKVLNNSKLPEEKRMNRTIGTAAIDPASGLLFVPDFSGFLHCLNADTGEHIWTHNLESPIWGSPMICDGKVYQGSENGMVTIFELSNKDNKIAEHDMGSPVYSTPVYSNGTLYVMTRDKLFAISDKK